MRILGFARKDWPNYVTGKPKLEEALFTTFRFTRRDRDWEVNELVQIVIKPRTKGREPLGIARIIQKGSFWLNEVDEEDALRDGFSSFEEMWDTFTRMHGRRVVEEPVNRLTLEWVQEGG